MSDDDLWQAVVKTVKPLGSKKNPEKAENISLEKKLSLNIKPLRRDPDLDVKTYAPLEAGDISALDRKNGKRLKAGEMPVEGRLDLHGHTLETGFEALKNFIYHYNKVNARCLLVITGKGGFSGRGVIRAEFQNWMNSPEIRSLILAFSPAQIRDGGDGAFYVLLRRCRKDKS